MYLHTANAFTHILHNIWLHFPQKHISPLILLFLHFFFTFPCFSMRFCAFPTFHHTSCDHFTPHHARVAPNWCLTFLTACYHHSPSAIVLSLLSLTVLAYCNFLFIYILIVFIQNYFLRYSHSLHLFWFNLILFCIYLVFCSFYFDSFHWYCILLSLYDLLELLFFTIFA